MWDTSSANDGIPITPSDTVDFGYGRALYVGGAGDVAVMMKSGRTVTFKAVLAGSVLPIKVNRVLATGTTATNMIGLI